MLAAQVPHVLIRLWKQVAHRDSPACNVQAVLASGADEEHVNLPPSMRAPSSIPSSQAKLVKLPWAASFEIDVEDQAGLVVSTGLWLHRSTRGCSWTMCPARYGAPGLWRLPSLHPLPARHGPALEHMVTVWRGEGCAGQGWRAGSGQTLQDQVGSEGSLERPCKGQVAPSVQLATVNCEHGQPSINEKTMTCFPHSHSLVAAVWPLLGRCLACPAPGALQGLLPCKPILNPSRDLMALAIPRMARQPAGKYILCKASQAC